MSVSVLEPERSSASASRAASLTLPRSLAPSRGVSPPLLLVSTGGGGAAAGGGSAGGGGGAGSGASGGSWPAYELTALASSSTLPLSCSLSLRPNMLKPWPSRDDTLDMTAAPALAVALAVVFACALAAAAECPSPSSARNASRLS